MSPKVHLAVDAMGGDFGPRLSVPASLDFLQKYPDSRITLVGDSALIQAELAGRNGTRINVQHAPDVVEAGEKPSHALRKKRSSSLWCCLELIAQNEADACVSAGNTGALMAMGKHLLGTFSGVSRPAICKPIPAQGGSSFLLDLGANLDCTAEHLVQFALMGAALARTCGVANPRVALLNVGAEESKGSQEVREAADSLRGLESLNFIGFIEGDAIFSRTADVIVCDGFAGNVALKVSEGAARLLFRSLDRRLKTSVRGRIARWLGAPELLAWQAQFSPSKYNGASLLGLRKPVIKSHGAADAMGFVEALAAAREHVKAALVDRLEQELASAASAFKTDFQSK